MVRGLFIYKIIIQKEKPRGIPRGFSLINVFLFTSLLVYDYTSLLND